MVQLDLSSFEEACRQMKTHSGIQNMRISVKTRPSNRVVILKATDDKVTLTCRLKGLNDLKVLERILGEYVSSSMAMAPLVAPEDENNGGNNNSNQKKSKKGKKAAAK